jgi:hypothetical protein
MKTCSCCKICVEESLFYKDKTKKDGLASRCIPCQKAYWTKYYKLNSEKIKNTAREWEANNRERKNKRSNEWRAKNREHYLARKSELFKKSYHGNIDYKINYLIRACLRRVLKSSSQDKNFITFKKIGYTSNQLKESIESKFKDGMSWSNHGEWEIDHVVPISIMVGFGERDVKKINSLDNLQPKWKTENRSKGARYVG